MVLGLRVHVYTMYTIHRPLRRWYWGAKSQFLFVIQIIWLLFPVPSVLSHPSRADIKDFVLSLCLVPALTLPQAPGSRGLRSTLSVSQSPSPSVKLKSQHGTGPLVPSIQAICHILIRKIKLINLAHLCHKSYDRNIQSSERYFH